MYPLPVRARSGRAVACVAFVALLCTGQTAWAGLIQAGGSYTVTGTNFVTNYSQNVTVDAQTHLVDSGLVNLTLTVVPDGPNAEWDVFRFTTTNGGPLAGNLNALWRLDMTNIPFNQAVAFDGFFAQWNVNGTAVSPIFPFGGGALRVVHTNPTNIVPGPVYGGTVSGPIVPPGTTLNLPNLIFVSPYSFVSAGGIDPNTANGFIAGLHFTAVNPTAVPEPSGLALLALGGAGLIPWARRRMRGAA
jgi:hypothetical protein